MVDISFIVHLVIPLIFLLVAAYFSFRIYRFDRLNNAWAVLTAAFLLMAMRSVADLILLPETIVVGTTLQFLDVYILPGLISLTILWGIWSMKKTFENFELVERKNKLVAKLIKDRKGSKITLK